MHAITSSKRKPRNFTLASLGLSAGALRWPLELHYASRHQG